MLYFKIISRLPQRTFQWCKQLLKMCSHCSAVTTSGEFRCRQPPHIDSFPPYMCIFGWKQFYFQILFFIIVFFFHNITSRRRAVTDIFYILLQLLTGMICVQIQSFFRKLLSKMTSTQFSGLMAIQDIDELQNETEWFYLRIQSRS